MAELPVHPRLARMVTAGADLGFGADRLLARRAARGARRAARPPRRAADRRRRPAATRRRHGDGPSPARSVGACTSSGGGPASWPAGRASSRGPSGRPDRPRPGWSWPSPTPTASRRPGATAGSACATARGAWLPEGDALAGEPFLVVADRRSTPGRARARRRTGSGWPPRSTRPTSSWPPPATPSSESRPWPGTPSATTCGCAPNGASAPSCWRRADGPAEPGDATVRRPARPRPGHAPRRPRLDATPPGRSRPASSSHTAPSATRWPDVSDDALLAAARRVVGATPPRRHAAAPTSSGSTWAGVLPRPRRPPPGPPARRRRPDDVHRWPTDGALAIDYGGEQPTIAGPGAGPLRHDVAPVRRRRADPARRPPALTRRSAGADHRRPSRLLGRHRGPRSARTWPAATPSTTGRSTPPRPSPAVGADP